MRISSFVMRGRACASWRFAFLTAGLLLATPLCHADIFQWEWINPANPWLGKRPSLTLAPDGAGLFAAPLATLGAKNLTQAYLIGADLTAASMNNTNLTDADLSSAILSYANLSFANVTNANFAGAVINNAKLYYTVGLTPAQLYSTASYQSRNLQGVSLWLKDLSGWNFSNQHLDTAYFGFATLTGANFTGATVAGTNFSSTTAHGFTAAQLYSTAGHQSRELSGIDLSTNDLSNWNFAQQNLAGANFSTSNFSGADFTGASLVNASFSGSTGSGNFSRADLRGANGFTGAQTANAILQNGAMNSPAIAPGQTLRIRDFDGTPGAVLGTYNPVPITVNTSFSIAGGATLSVALHDSNWGSTISFSPGAVVSLGGTLRLGIESSADIAGLVGSPIHLFSWNATPDAGNRFAQISTDPRLKWDTTQLYSAGNITITHLFGDANSDDKVDIRDLYTLAINWQRGSHAGDAAPGWSTGDFTGNGVVDAADLALLAQSWQMGCNPTASSPSLATALAMLGFSGDVVPEPSGAMVVIAIAGIMLSRHRPRLV